MNENSKDLLSEKPYDGPDGWAVKRKGEISVRTSSPTATGAKINGLVLFFGVPAGITYDWSGEYIAELWEKETGRIPEEELSVVRVTCVEVQQGEVT